MREARFRHVNENKEIEKATKRDEEGQKSNTGAAPNRESNNVEISEKEKREKEEVTQGFPILASSSCDVLCQGEQKEGEEYALGENSRRADEQGAILREKGKEDICGQEDTDCRSASRPRP